MRFLTGRLTPSLLAVLVLVNLCLAQPPARDPNKEERLHQQLKSIAPKAVAAFRAGTDAMDSGDFNTCIGQYNDVLSQAPKFDPAMRRIGHCLVGLGRRDDGYAMIQQAIDLNRSADNLLSMALARVEPGQNEYIPPKGEMERALSFAIEGSKLTGDSDSDGLLMIADLSLRVDRLDQFNAALANLTAKFPDNPYTHYFSAINEANAGDFNAALAAVKKAESLGLDPVEAERLTVGINKLWDETHPLRPYLTYIYVFLALVLLWAIGLLTLYLLGRRLSATTLAVIESSDPNDITGGGPSAMKATYRRVIAFAGLYYYISQPMVVGLVIVITGGLIYGFFLIGRIPIAFLLGLIFVGGGSIFFMCKSLIFRPKVEDPGRVLNEKEAPQLWELVRNVADDIQTRRIDEIRVTPGVDLAVYERGSFRDKLNDRGERILILGAGSFNAFSTNAFRAVLAHEYGHLSNRDTAGGDIAFRVNADMSRLAEAMVNSETNTYHNLAFHFLRLYHFIFRRITHGASRLQEVLADRVAVNTYGATAFCEGLKHVVRQEIVFHRLADAEVSAALADRRRFNNLYDLTVQTEGDSEEIERAFKAEFERQTTDDDTHPAGADRIRFAERTKGQRYDDIEGTVWDLFSNREEFTNGMNLMLEQQVRGERYKNYHDMGIADAAN